MSEYKRYFHASYSHSSGFGACTMTTVNSFPSADHIIKSARESLNRPDDNIIIISIFEMDIKDFDDFVGNNKY